MTLPRHYNRRLQRFDPLLRMRWSAQEEHWVLERKYRWARDLDPSGLDLETYVQARDGYLTLSTYPPRELPQIDRLILHLGWADTWRHGYSPEQFADVYEQHQEVRDAARERAVQRHFRDRASDTWEDVASLTGARSYARHTGYR